MAHVGNLPGVRLLWLTDIKVDRVEARDATTFAEVKQIPASKPVVKYNA